MQIQLSKATSKVKLTVLNTIAKSQAAQLENDFPCKSGCASCCYRMARITVAEAMVMYSYLIETKQWGTVQTELKKQIALGKNVDPTAWFKMKIECPVLDKESKTCRAYKVRPIFCSTHFVSSKPEACDPWYTGTQAYKPAYQKEIYDNAIKRMKESIGPMGVLGIELSIHSALLFAERVSVRSGLTFEQVIQIISNEH